MMPNYRTPLLVPAPKRPAGALSIDRVPTAVLGFAVVCSLLLSALTADRLARVERDYRPAVEETRQLKAALEATRVLLADHRLGALEPRIARADSQAQRFHNIASAYRAGTEPRAQMQGYDATFAEYYVAARRAAAGLSMSAEADGSSAEDAALGHEQLRENLALGLDLHEQAIDAARLSTAPAELAGWLTLGLLAGAMLLRRSNLMADWPVAARAVAARPAGRDDRSTPVAEASPAVVPLRDALERLARQRLAASVAAAKVAKRNNERQIEVARTWNAPMLSIVPTEAPRGGMDVYEDDRSADEPRFGGLTLVTA